MLLEPREFYSLDLFQEFVLASCGSEMESQIFPLIFTLGLQGGKKKFCLFISTPSSRVKTCVSLQICIALCIVNFTHCKFEHFET